MDRPGSAPARSSQAAAALYGGLAYVITWLAVSPLVAESLGLAGTVLPSWWHAVGAAGPVGAAFVAARVSGGEGMRSWVESLTRFRIGARWWAVVVGSPLVLGCMALVVGRITTGAWLGDLTWSDLPGTWWLGTLTVSVAYGVGEEPGWRGYMLPRLMERHSASVATLILALVWAAWHIPFFTYRYDFAGPVTVVGFLIAMLAGALWLSFVFLSTGGSVPAVVVWHVLWNVVNLVAGETSDLVVAVLNTAMIVLGFGVLLATRGRLRVGRDDAPRGLDSGRTSESR